jgi:hypothetical protein
MKRLYNFGMGLRGLDLVRKRNKIMNSKLVYASCFLNALSQIFIEVHF